MKGRRTRRKGNKSRKDSKSRKQQQRSQRQCKQRGGAGSTELPSGYDYPVTAKLPSGEIGDPDSIPTVIPKSFYEALRGADADEAPPS